MAEDAAKVAPHVYKVVFENERARVLDPDGRPLDGLYAAGADAGGVSTGGYASGLASALVLGRAAAEVALR